MVVRKRGVQNLTTQPLTCFMAGNRGKTNQQQELVSMKPEMMKKEITKSFAHKTSLAMAINLWTIILKE